jgi:hypothetical protein
VNKSRESLREILAELLDKNPTSALIDEKVVEYENKLIDYLFDFMLITADIQRIPPLEQIVRDFIINPPWDYEYDFPSSINCILDLDFVFIVMTDFRESLFIYIDRSK